MIAEVIEVPTSSTLLDSQNPYPGLQAFEEHDQDYFYGRESERDELARKIRREVLTVLFGRSGLGKSSLLRAGVFPVLREERFLPLTIRLDFSAGAESLVGQVRALIAEGLGSAEIEAPALGEDETLWEYFHRAQIWNDRNRLLTPLLVFDQFEEIFTLGHGDGRVKPFLTELSDLIENRIPAKVRERLVQTEDDLPFSYERQNFHVILSLREDYVAYLEDLKPLLPSIGLNHFRLNRMNGLQALEAVLKPGCELVDEEVARHILYFIAGSRQKGDVETSPRDLTELEVEPALLSLFCREINQKRLSRGLSRITAGLVAGEREHIVSGFYERSVADLPSAVQIFIEERLLTSSGFRRSEPLEDALIYPGVTQSALDSLVDRRLLRLERRLGTSQVELIHDLLSEVILDRRLSRRRREARRRRQRRLALAASLVLLLLVVGLLPLRSKVLQRKAETHSQHAEALINFMLFDLHDRLASIGRLDLLATAQQRMLTYFKNLPVDERSRDSVYDRGIALYNLGDVYLQQGRNREAMDLYKEALKTFDNLSQLDPSKLDSRHQVAVTHSRIAKALDQQGNLTASLSQLRTAFGILASLMKSHAGDKSFQKTFQSLRAELGQTLLRMGLCDDGRRYLQDAVRLAKELVKRDPKTPELKLRLAGFYILLGNADRAHGEIKNAHEMFSEAKQILADPTIDASHKLAYEREKARLSLGFGSAFLAAGDAANAFTSYETAFNMQRDVVVRTDSSATMATAALLDIRNAWAEAMLEKGDLKKAESTIADANSSGARLTLKDAGNSNWKSSLAVSRTVSGEIQAALHKPDQAIQSYQKAIEALNQLVLRSPEEIGLTRAQSWSHLLAGNAYKQMKADSKAREEWEQALAIIEPVALHVDDADVRDNYARALIALGQMERAQPICRELQAKGWNWKGFQDLCHAGSVALTVATR